MMKQFRYCNIKITALFGWLLLSNVCLAQQSGIYSLWTMDDAIINPAASGNQQSLMVNGIFRGQWERLSNNPFQQLVQAHAPVWSINSGVGIMIMNESLGQEQNTGGYVQYAYHLELTSNLKISLGAQAGVIQKSLNGSLLITPEGIYNGQVGIDHKDLILVNNNTRATVVDLGTGIIVKGKKWTAGVALGGLPRKSWQLNKDNGLSIVHAPSVIAHVSYFIPIDDDFSIKVSALGRKEESQQQLETSVIFDWQDLMFVGIGSRGYNNNTIDALIWQLGYRLNEQFVLRFAYDQTLSKLSRVQLGSFEIGLASNLFGLKFRKKIPPIIYNTRY